MRTTSSTGLVLAAIACAGGAAGCKKREPARKQAAPAPVPAEGTAVPLPGGSPDGAIGVAGEIELVRAADDGSWVVLCQGRPPRALRVVVGDGAGLVADRAVAASARDLAVVDGDALVHVDVAARTSRRLGPVGPVAIDDASRRLVQADGAKLIVRDPGVAPRTIEAGAAIAGMWLRGRRWLEIAPGDLPYDLQKGSCGWAGGESYGFSADGRQTIDLDPSGLEAPERIGPELGITAGGEVTLDGVKVVGAECVGEVIAAITRPPRALVLCGEGGNHVVGPGFDRKVGGRSGGSREQATIADNLVLGRRLVCISGACVDLVSGRDFATWDTPSVWADDRFLVRKGPAGLLVDDLDQERQRVVALPRITQAITVDTATGRRRAGAAPKPPAYIDAAGDYLLYGRHVVDVASAALVATMAEDGLAIDRSGRVLVPASEGEGPLRWRKP